ncbi:MAG: ATP-binding protein [Oscillospiraceae bacterium]|nr:ATP-binding protein [Oscillospiraceae bacterium]
MAIDGRILARAKNKLEEKRRQKDERLGRRLEKVYAAAPRVRDIDNSLRATMAQLVGVALGAPSSDGLEEIRLNNVKLQEERIAELTAAGFAKDYLDDDYMCPKCHDTGFVNNSMCCCLEDIYKEEQRVSLSNLFKLGTENFESFSLSYYDDSVSAGTGSPRRSMEMVFEICVEYARNFSAKSKNLFFNGSPGLGKTFLSACIARVVSENGFSVVYDTAASVFSKFEDAKFNRTDDIEGIRNETKRYLECELLIIDDLGTEMTTSFTISSLYEIINTRLITNRKTLINSNLTIDELRRKYSEQIMSRLEGEYQVLTFYGDDIRKKRNVL